MELRLPHMLHLFNVFRENKDSDNCAKACRGNDTSGITRIPTTIAGAQGCKKSKISSQHEDRLPRFGPRGCVKP